jgi:hypothetical protein
MSPSIRLRGRSMGRTVILVAIALLGGSLAAAPAHADVSHAISGHVYLGNSDTPAGEGDVAIHWRTVSDNYVFKPANVTYTLADGSYVTPDLVSDVQIFYEYIGTGDFSNVWWPQITPGFTGSYINLNGSTVALSNVNATLAAKSSISGIVSLADGSLAGDHEVKVGYEAVTTAINWTRELTFPGVFTDSQGHYELPNLGAGM